MFGLDDIAEGILGGTSLGVGVAAVAVAAVVAGPRAKPLAKNAIKGYFVAAEGVRGGYTAASQRVREWTAESSERLQDLYAEAKYEYETGLTDRAATDTAAAAAAAPNAATDATTSGSAPTDAGVADGEQGTASRSRRRGSTTTAEQPA